MLPRLSETLKAESTIQKEIIETLANPYVFTDVTPLQQCLAYHFPEWRDVEPCSTIAFNVFPLYALSITEGGKYDPLMIDVIGQMLPELDKSDLNTVLSWASGSWVKKVRLNDGASALRCYAVASAVNTEFDVYLVADKVHCCLELKLEAEFGTNFLLYQPFRQLMQLNILSKLYGFDYHFLYLVTMEREETLKQRLLHYYPRYIDDLIDIDLIKTLSWEMIRDWLDIVGLEQYPMLKKLRQRLNEHYILQSKALERDKLRDKIRIPQFILDNYYVRQPGTGEILEIPYLTTVGFYPAEITVGLNLLSPDVRYKWVTQFETAGFGATPKQNYWSFKFDSDASFPQTVEYLLSEFLEDICK